MTWLRTEINLDMSDYVPVQLMQQVCIPADVHKVYFLPFLLDDDYSWADVVERFSSFIIHNPQLTHIHSDVMATDSTFIVDNIPLKMLTLYPDHEYQHLLLKGQALADSLQWLSMTERMIPKISKEEKLLWKRLRVLTAFYSEDLYSFIKPVIDNAPAIEHMEIGYTIGNSDIEINTVGCSNYEKLDCITGKILYPKWSPVIDISPDLPLVTIPNGRVCRFTSGIFNISLDTLEELSAWYTQTIIIDKPLNVNTIYFEGCLPSWNKDTYKNTHLFKNVSHVSLINIKVKLIESFLMHPNFIDFDTVSDINLFVYNNNEDDNEHVLINAIERITSNCVKLDRTKINILTEQTYYQKYARTFAKFYGFGHDMWSKQ